GSWGSEEQRVITIELGAGQNQQINLSAEFGVEFSLNLTNPVLLNITRPTGSVGGVAPPGLAFLGIFVLIEVNDTTAIEGITIIIHYTDQQIAELGLDESSLAMWYWNESSGNWVLLPSTVDTGNNIVFAHTDHLTYFAILGGLLPSGLPISPYLMFVLLFQLTQSELHPLIFLALGLVAVVIIAVTGLVLLIRREEEAAPTITAPARQWSTTTVEGSRCQFCGADIPENANFCIFCGGARARCSICNNELGSGDVVVSCPHCGAQGHRDHFLEWIKIRGTCPNCKEGLNRLDIV
ncbi:MAG: RING finger domain-containing protein, partial [Candidatus Lokiarchaeia archaeon]